MKRSSGVRLCAIAAVSALSLALVTGCSGEGSKGSGDGADRKPAAKTLSVAELKKLIIAEGDVPGYKVGAVPAGRARPITPEGATCGPLARVMSGLPPAQAAAQTDRLATENQKKRPTDKATSPDDKTGGKFEDAMKQAMDRDVTTVSLSSYDGDGAAKALKAVSDAVKACAGGFSGKQAGTTMKFTKVAEGTSSGTGDESVAFVATSDMEDGDTAPVHAEVVRHGNTVASYFTTNLGAMMSKKTYAVSPEVVKAQSAKLK